MEGALSARSCREVSGAFLWLRFFIAIPQRESVWPERDFRWRWIQKRLQELLTEAQSRAVVARRDAEDAARESGISYKTITMNFSCGMTTVCFGRYDVGDAFLFLR